jgi:hypothetical protein
MRTGRAAGLGLRGAARTGFLAGARLAVVFLEAFLRGFAAFRRRTAGLRAGAFLRFTLDLVFLLAFAFFLAAMLTSRRLEHVIKEVEGLMLVHTPARIKSARGAGVGLIPRGPRIPEPMSSCRKGGRSRPLRLSRIQLDQNLFHI